MNDGSMKSRVLIIDGDEEAARRTAEFLELAGLYTETAATGSLGLSRALSADFDAVLTEVVLPDTDGFSVCRDLRAERDIPILFLTERTEEIDCVRALSLGADDYLIKPVSPAILTAKVKANISRYRTLKGDRLEVTDAEIRRFRELVINTRTEQAFFEGRELSLSRKEYEILLFLSSFPNHAFSKEEIFEAVWSESANADVRTVSVHIKRLRAKIESDPRTPKYLCTEWGRGYLLRV